MASEYNLALKATLDTSQVQQQLQRLKHSYTAGSDDGNFSKGAPGAAHMQKIEVQLTKLNSAITGLQRAVEQLARQQGQQNKQAAPSNVAKNSGMPPVALPNIGDRDTILKNLRQRLGPDFDFNKFKAQRGVEGTPERA